VERCVQRREVRGSGCDAFDEAMGAAHGAGT
jgi:hypothetical protein